MRRELGKNKEGTGREGWGMRGEGVDWKKRAYGNWKRIRRELGEKGGE